MQTAALLEEEKFRQAQGDILSKTYEAIAARGTVGLNVTAHNHSDTTQMQRPHSAAVFSSLVTTKPSRLADRLPKRRTPLSSSEIYKKNKRISRFTSFPKLGGTSPYMFSSGVPHGGSTEQHFDIAKKWSEVERALSISK